MAGYQIIVIKGGERFIEKEMYYEKNPCVLLLIDNMEYVFIYNGSYYFYYTQNGKISTLDIIESYGFKGLEYMASGRGYIWSRVIPVIRRYWLYGSGLDTFPEAFPQDDYVGKYIYSKDPVMIIENAHNMYLGIMIGIGIPGFCIFFLAAVYQLIRSCIALRKKTTMIIMGSLAGMVVFLLTGLFYDGSMFTTPVFAALAGINIFHTGRMEK